MAKESDNWTRPEHRGPRAIIRLDLMDKGGLVSGVYRVE